MMTPFEILTPIVLVLAFIGYVWCLSRMLWISVGLTAVLAFYMSNSIAVDPSNMIYWGAAAGVFICALLATQVLPEGTAAQPTHSEPTVKGGPEVVIDGTNVMFWNGDADLDTLRSVVDHLKGKGMRPYVFLDASSRHHLKDKSLNENGFAKALGLTRDRVMVCPAQTEADAFILKFAQDQELPVISNDRFGDRAKQAKGIKVVKGVMARGKPILQGL